MTIWEWVALGVIAVLLTFFVVTFGVQMGQPPQGV